LKSTLVAGPMNGDSSMPSLVAYVTPEFRYRFVNDGYERWFGITSSKIVGSHVSEIAGDAAFAQAKPRMEEALRGNGQEFTYNAPLKMGQAKVLRCRFVPDFDASGHVQGFISLIDDVTLQTDISNKFENIYNSAPIGLVTLDENLKYTSVNRAFEDIIGYTESELIGKSMLNLTYEEDRKASHLKAEGLKTTELEVKKFEKRYVHKSGRIIWARVTSRLQTNALGQKFFQAVIEDVTEFKEARAEAESIIDGMSEGLVIQRENGSIEKFNQEALNILGLTADEMAGRTSMDPRWQAFREDGTSFPGHEHPAMISLATGKPVRDVTMGLRLPSGEMRWIRINSTPFSSATGRKVASTFQDVTQLVNLNEDVNHLFSNAIDMMVIARMDGSIKRVSPSCMAVLGYPEHEILENSIFQFLHVDDHPSTVAVLERSSKGERVVDFEVRVVTKDGSARLFSWVCEPDLRSGLLYATGREMTKQRQLEDHLRQMMNAINQSAIVAFTDLNGMITDVNDNFCKLSQYSRAELIGKDHRVVNSGAHSKKFMQELWSTILSDKIWTGDLENKAKDGTHFFVRTLIMPVKNLSGHIERFMSVHFDITREKMVEQEVAKERLKTLQSSKLASLGEMAAGIAHEINNPLTVIAGSTRMIPKILSEPDRVLQKTQMIEKSVERIAKIVKSLRKFSRTSVKGETKSLDLARVIEDAILMTEVRVKRASATLEVRLLDDINVLGNELELEQVFVNLITNAVDAIAQLNDKWIKVDMKRSTGRVIVSICDAGSGIPAQIRDRLFEPFFTTKPVGEGTGLGLSIVKGILDDHRATIEIDQTRSNTCFLVSFIVPDGGAKA
jgi:PAS domain S-box-containing protein